MKINLNIIVRLQLSDKGWAIYNALHEVHRAALAHNLKLNGVLELPLWQFAQLFGPHLYQTGAAVAVENEIEILPDYFFRISPAPKPLRKTTVKKGRSA